VQILRRSVPVGAAHHNLKQQHRSWKPKVHPSLRQAYGATHTEHMTHNTASVWDKEAPGVYSFPHEWQLIWLLRGQNQRPITGALGVGGVADAIALGGVKGGSSVVGATRESGKGSRGIEACNSTPTYMYGIFASQTFFGAGSSPSGIDHLEVLFKARQPIGVSDVPARPPARANNIHTVYAWDRMLHRDIPPMDNKFRIRATTLLATHTEEGRFWKGAVESETILLRHDRGHLPILY
jgi:hypothetical protein